MRNIDYLSKKIALGENSEIASQPWESLPDPDRRLLDYEDNEWEATDTDDIWELEDLNQWE